MSGARFWEYRLADNMESQRIFCTKAYLLEHVIEKNPSAVFWPAENDLKANIEDQVLNEIHMDYNNKPDILDQREATHGDFREVSRISQTICYAIRTGPSWEDMTFFEKQIIDSLAGKIARIVCGNHAAPEHWEDLVGYSCLWQWCQNRNNRGSVGEERGGSTPAASRGNGSES